MRFAILTHDHPFPHWDLLLQTGETCRCWRLLASPDSPGPISAEALGDHRVFYLDYEGPVSGNRGTVSRWDRGQLIWLTAREDCIRARCCGTKLNGLVRLRRTADEWRFEFSEEPRTK